MKEWQRERKVNRWNGTLKHNNPLKAKKKKEKIALERQNTGDTYLVKWRNFASMLRWRIHILVRAEPTSLVAPWMRQTKQIVTLKIGITDQRCASWRRKIWFSMRTYNTSGGSILKSLILFCQDGVFFFPAGDAFPAAATRWTSANCKSRALKCHICLGKANVTQCFQTETPALPPSWQNMHFTLEDCVHDRSVNNSLCELLTELLSLCWSVIKWGFSP